jgi:hypothetical protein
MTGPWLLLGGSTTVARGPIVAAVKGPKVACWVVGVSVVLVVFAVVVLVVRVVRVVVVGASVVRSLVVVDVVGSLVVVDVEVEVDVEVGADVVVLVVREVVDVVDAGATAARNRATAPAPPDPEMTHCDPWGCRQPLQPRKPAPLATSVTRSPDA